jgi:uncharacterized protein (DUF1778 family)
MSINFNEEKRDKVITFKVTAEEKKLIEKASKDNNVGISKFVRSVTLSYVDEEKK